MSYEYNLYNCLLYDPWLNNMTSSFRLTYFEKGEASYFISVCGVRILLNNIFYKLLTSTKYKQRKSYVILYLV